MVKIWHISDTHGFHRELVVPGDIDIVIHSGDAGNYRNAHMNNNEILDFAGWYSSLNIPHKVYVAGNHDSAVERKMVTPADFAAGGITYLENNSTTIMGLKIWGSPITPTFGDWSFMKKRDKIHEVWDLIPVDTDIIVTHGPPKGILDISFSREGLMEYCGCRALYKRVIAIQPKLVCFGHIHNMDDVHNAGIRTIVNSKTIFSNGACVYDGRFDKGATSHGNIIDI